MYACCNLNMYCEAILRKNEINIKTLILDDTLYEQILNIKVSGLNKNNWDTPMF